MNQSDTKKIIPFIRNEKAIFLPFSVDQSHTVKLDSNLQYQTDSLFSTI